MPTVLEPLLVLTNLPQRPAEIVLQIVGPFWQLPLLSVSTNQLDLFRRWVRESLIGTVTIQFSSPLMHLRAPLALHMFARLLEVDSSA